MEQVVCHGRRQANLPSVPVGPEALRAETAPRQREGNLASRPPDEADTNGADVAGQRRPQPVQPGEVDARGLGCQMEVGEVLAEGNRSRRAISSVPARVGGSEVARWLRGEAAAD